MKFYLSSHKLGNETEKLKALIDGKTIGFIPNALDAVDEIPRKKSNERNMDDVRKLGITVEMVDLKDYFGNKDALKKKLESLGGVWVRGGNTFVLRQAMKLSGFDYSIKNMKRDDFLYAGYSAGVCVLAPSLTVLKYVDEPDCMPYQESKEVLWGGLGLFDYIILPHFRSNHPESDAIDKVVAYCQENNIPFKTLRDGDVIIIE